MLRKQYSTYAYSAGIHAPKLSLRALSGYQVHIVRIGSGHYHHHHAGDQWPLMQTCNCDIHGKSDTEGYRFIPTTVNGEQIALLGCSALMANFSQDRRDGTHNRLLTDAGTSNSRSVFLVPAETSSYTRAVEFCGNATYRGSLLFGHAMSSKVDFLIAHNQGAEKLNRCGGESTHS